MKILDLSNNPKIAFSHTETVKVSLKRLLLRNTKFVNHTMKTILSLFETNGEELAIGDYFINFLNLNLMKITTVNILKLINMSMESVDGISRLFELLKIEYLDLSINLLTDFKIKKSFLKFLISSNNKIKQFNIEFHDFINLVELDLFQLIKGF